MDNVIKAILDKGMETARLRLRPLRLSDQDDIFEYSCDAETCKYLKWGPYTDKKPVEEFLEKAICEYKAPNAILWGLETKTNAKLVGAIRIYNIGNTAAAVSYVLNRTYMGQGLMTEAVEAAISVCFDSLGLSDVYAYYIDDNTGSKRVMERTGMIESGRTPEEVVLKGRTHLQYAYYISREASK